MTLYLKLLCLSINFKKNANQDFVCILKNQLKKVK